MAELSFLDKLTPAQIAYAVKVGNAAKEAGVPVKLAIAIAYQESGLNPNAPNGEAGEIGGMQIKPNTAKIVGSSLDDIKTEEGNIKAGIAYLKMGWDKTGQKPQLTAYGYNRGYDDPLFYGGEVNPSGKTYFESIGKFGAYEGLTTTDAAKTEGEPSEGGAKVDPNKPVLVETTDQDNAPPPIASGASKAERVFYGGSGTLAGATVALGKSLLGAKDARSVRLAQLTGAAAEKGRLAAQAADEAAKVGKVMPPSFAPPSSLPKIEPINMSVAGGQGATSDLTKATGRGSAVVNYGTKYGLGDIEANQALSTKKEKGGVWDLLAKRQDSINRINELFPSGSFVENQQYGGLMTSEGRTPKASYKVQGPLSAEEAALHQLDLRRMSASGETPAQGALVQIPKPKPPPVPPPPTMVQRAAAGLDEVTNLFKSMGQPLANVGKTIVKYGGPPAAGLSFGLDVAEGAHEYRKPEDERDLIKVGTKGVGALGGALSMFPYTAPAGIPMMLGATGVDLYRDPEKRAYIKKMMEDAQRGVMSNVGVPFEFGPSQ
jgi:hypothetical protein